MVINKSDKIIKILVVEDHAPDRAMIMNAIKNSGIPNEIFIAETIDHGLDLAMENNIDCIFLDYYFPEKNGIDFIRSYTEFRGNASIIMVTSQDDANMAVECMKMGASDYLTKNHITPASINKSLNYVLKLKNVQDNAAKTEQALLESELKLKSIIARSPIILFNIDSTGKITLFRGKATNCLILKPEEVIGQNISDVWKSLPIKYDDYLKACKEEQLQFKAEINNHFFDVNYIPVKNELKKLTGIMGVAIDITSFKKNEAELKSAIVESEASSKIKEQFLANMSHEIRTPIHGIISLTQFIMNTSLTSDQINYLELIKKSADTLLVIVNDILDLSKIDSGKMTFEEVPFNLKDTIQTSVAAFIPKTIEKNIQIRTHLSNELPEYISGDPVRLTQIINNLLGNAVKFTEKGYVSIGASIKENNGEYSIIEFTIRDSGIGIPPHKIGSIFESFTQAGSDITRKYGGTGLGLNITKQLVEKQNGTIQVESLLDAGTTFIISIPYKIIDEKQLTINPIITKTEQTITKELSILVAEDHDINRFIIAKMLNEWGFKHDFATTGTEAVDLASKKVYDLILMDVEMPDMNGYKATEIIRSELNAPIKNVPIVAMTGNAMTGERERCLNCGMNEYISKPFKPEELKNMIVLLTKDENSTTTNNEEMNIQESVHNTNKITDLSFLKEISDSNDAFFKEFITMFLENTPKSIAEMQLGVDNQDWEKLRQASHKVKPSFNYVGLKELNAKAARIEELSKNKSGMEEIKSCLNYISEKAKIAFKELEEEINTIAH
jgi:PAS domain S-box-containing protein